MWFKRVTAQELLCPDSQRVPVTLYGDEAGGRQVIPGWGPFQAVSSRGLLWELFILWLSSSFSEHTQSTGEASALLVPGSVGGALAGTVAGTLGSRGWAFGTHPHRPSLPEKPGRRWLTEGGRLAPGPAGRVEENLSKGAEGAAVGAGGLEPEAGVGGLLKEAGEGARGGGGRAGAAPGAAGRSRGRRKVGRSWGWGGEPRGLGPLSRPRPPRGPAAYLLVVLAEPQPRCRTGSRCPRPRSTSRWGRRPSSPHRHLLGLGLGPRRRPAPLSSAPASASSSARLPPPPRRRGRRLRRLGRPRPAQLLPVGRTRWRPERLARADLAASLAAAAAARLWEAASWRSAPLPRSPFADLRSFLASQPVEWVPLYPTPGDAGRL